MFYKNEKRGSLYGPLFLLKNSNGYLIAMKDKYGNTVTINVNDSGKVTSIVDSAGRLYSITYNGQGLIEKITDPLGRVISYEYKNGRLVKVIDAMNSVTTYKYNSDGFAY